MMLGQVGRLALFLGYAVAAFVRRLVQLCLPLKKSTRERSGDVRSVRRMGHDLRPPSRIPKPLLVTRDRYGQRLLDYHSFSDT